MRKPRRLYLGRMTNGQYELGVKKRSWDREGGFEGDGYVMDFCGGMFEAITGVRLKKGQTRKVRKITIEFDV